MNLADCRKCCTMFRFKTGLEFEFIDFRVVGFAVVVIFRIVQANPGCAGRTSPDGESEFSHVENKSYSS